MKKTLSLLYFSWIFLLLSGCSSTTEAETSIENDTDKTLVIYSPNPEDLIEETIPAFEEKYGIKVDLVQASTGELFKKAEAYNDLLNPKLKGKIATADPSNSSSAFAQLTNMLVDQGGYENEQAWTYVKNLFSLVDGKIASSSSNVYKSVADGEMAVGLTYEDPALKLLNDGVDVKVIYPKEGTVFLPGNAAIIKNAKHMENAKKFIDFLLSQDIQDKLGTETTIRPIRKNAKTNKNMKAMTEINIATEDSEYVIQNKSAILKKYNDIFTNIQSKQ